MSMQLTLGTPWIFVLLCLLLGVAYAAMLYFLQLRPLRVGEGNEGFSKRVRWTLSLSRALSVAAIAFFLLSPLLRRQVNETQKPIVVVAEDNSKSLDYSADSAMLHGGYAAAMNQVVEQLAKTYEVRRYQYGSSPKEVGQGVSPSYDDRATDIGALLRAIGEDYAGRNVGAVLLTGDGILNRGDSPLTMAQQLTMPIFTVALGDTAVRRDAAIAHVRCNEVAYRGNAFPVEVTVRAERLNGARTSLVVTQGGKRLHTAAVAYDAETFSATLSFELEAGQAGIQQYEIRLEAVQGEHTLRNNTYSLTVEVMDDEQRIALVAAAPHPDIAALRRAIETHKGYEVESATVEEWKGRFDDYDLVVLHQLPAQGGVGQEVARQAMAAQVPVAFVLGASSDLPRFNALRAGVQVASRVSRPNAATASYNGDFTAFAMDGDVARAMEAFPPLLSPFGTYSMAAHVQALFYAKIGAVRSSQPLVAMGALQGRRVVVVTGEGLWRWRLADYQRNGNSKVFDEWVGKLVTYATLQPKGDPFRVRTKRMWDVGDEVTFDAELYNDSYEPVSNADVSIEIARDGERHSYPFSRVGVGYQARVGILEPGTYQYVATALLGGKRHQAKGSFVVRDLNLESLNLVADHALLNTLSHITGGQMLTPSRLGEFPALLRQRGDVVPVIYTRTSHNLLLDLPWVFVIIIVMLSAEWVIRKHGGEA